MSFILDALRKSETERRRTATPMLAGVPAEVARTAVPAWMWAVIALLGFAVIGLGGAWWNSQRQAAMSRTASSEAPALPARVSPTDPRDALSAARGSVGQAPPDATTADFVPGNAAARPAAGGALSTAGPVTAADVRDGAAATPGPDLARGSPVVGDTEPGSALSAPVSPATAADTLRDGAAAPVLPTVEEMRAAGVEVPTLSLELHVYHTDPGARWVYINGGRYTEGRQLADGPRLVEILPEGVVLSFAGREFLLLAQ